MKKTNTECKGTSLYEVLQAEFEGVINLSCVKLMSLLIWLFLILKL